MWRRKDSESFGRVEDEPHLRREEPARDSDTETNAVGDEPGLAWTADQGVALPSYGDHFERRRAATSSAAQWVTVLLAGIAAGPFAVGGAFLQAMTGRGGFGHMAIIVFGPIIEEVLKIACALMLVERRPWLLPGVGGILCIGALGGLGFAAIENVMYLRVYFPDHGLELAQWRWTVNVALHTGCTLIAALGVARVWRAVVQERRPPDLNLAYPWLIAAIVIHGAYNAFAMVLGMLGHSPQ